MRQKEILGAHLNGQVSVALRDLFSHRCYTDKKNTDVTQIKKTQMLHRCQTSIFGEHQAKIFQ
jgi:hypothetical protein